MVLQDTVIRGAAEHPDKVAIVAGTRRLTYADLDTWTNRIANCLLEAGCQPGDRVGLLLPKSPEAIAAMIGTLKAGAIYVPMDTKSPGARVAKIVDVCTPSFILSRPTPILESVRESARSAFQVGYLQDSAGSGATFGAEQIAAAPADPPQNESRPSDIAHILFTSGSTGVPKGVTITHANVLRFLDWAIPYFQIAGDDRHSCHPPLHFDLSTFDVFGTLRAGAELHLVPDEASLLPQKLSAFIRDSELTQWFSVPSALKFMAQFDTVRPNDFPKLKRLLWCGEALPTPTLMYWMRKVPHVQFTNLYGPTEATIASSYFTVPECPASETDVVPIGRPCGGEDLEVLDETLRRVPPGEVGDLYISGTGLSPGYWLDPEKTAAAFIIDASGVRRYKTGDLAREGPDGLLYLLGRSDSQIKSRGFRIELGEIETALLATPGVRECAVVAIPSSDFDGMSICCAYTAPGNIEGAILREKVSSLLPAYMIPTRWLQLDSLPLNGNGKIDRPRVRQQFEALTVGAA